MTPLKEFMCDHCGQIINDPTEGTAEWIEKFDNVSGRYISSDYKIIHQFGHSPVSKHRTNGCRINGNQSGYRDTNLSAFLNPNSGLSYLYSFVDPGPYHQKNYHGPNVKDSREFIEFARRLTIANYEEARLYWQSAINDNFFDGDNEINVYDSAKLKRLIDKYKP